MTTITRREFLQMSGVVLAGSQWLSAFGGFAAKNELMQGRALAPLTVTRADGSSTATLLPDSIVSILGADGDRFRVPGGVVPRALVQPMTVTRANDTLPALPFLAEVCAPVAPVHASCAADAPLLTRIGHAGTATVLSRLPDGHGGADWYEVEAGGIIGWSQSTFWTPADIVGADVAHSVVIDRQTQTLTAFDGDGVALQAMVSVAPSLLEGAYTVSGRQPSGSGDDGSNRYVGAPWLLALDGGGQIGGAYWHNQFGAPMPGMAVQAAPQVARWLYGWLGDGSTVRVR